MTRTAAAAVLAALIPVLAATADAAPIDPCAALRTAPAARKLAFESDDNAPIAGLGDRAFGSQLFGVFVASGDREFRVAVRRRSAAALEAEGVSGADLAASARLARVLLPSLTRAAP